MPPPAEAFGARWDRFGAGAAGAAAVQSGWENSTSLTAPPPPPRPQLGRGEAGGAGGCGAAAAASTRVPRPALKTAAPRPRLLPPLPPKKRKPPAAPGDSGSSPGTVAAGRAGGSGRNRWRENSWRSRQFSAGTYRRRRFAPLRGCPRKRRTAGWAGGRTGGVRRRFLCPRFPALSRRGCAPPMVFRDRDDPSERSRPGHDVPGSALRGMKRNFP